MKQLGAFLLSPIPAAVLGAIVSWATGGFPRPVSLAIFYLLLLYAVQLLFGIAIRAFLLRSNRLSAASFAFGGAAMTGIPAMGFFAWAMVPHPDSSVRAVAVLVLWILLGALTGLSYWGLARPAARTDAAIFN